MNRPAGCSTRLDDSSRVGGPTARPAADAGYKLIVVLAGVHKNMRSQTQMRLDEGFLGYETMPVTRIEGHAKITLHLNDESTEPLDPTTLRVGADHVLYAQAKQGHRVRFLRNAYYALARFADLTADGTISLAVQGRVIPLGIGPV